MSQTVEVRVNVPADRETEFYRWFADWREGPQSSDPAGVATPTEPDLESAIAWWKSLKAREAALWSMWVDAAPSMVSAETIVQTLGLESTRAIPGVLAWSGRKGRRVGFPVDWRFRYDSMTGNPIYGLEDERYAALIGQARDALG
jgi:hypothetical protein